MLMLSELHGFNAPYRSIDLTPTASDVNTGDLATYTFAGKSLGAADSQREILVATSSRGASNEVPTSVTVAGITATQIFSTGGAGDLSHVGIYRVSVPTGATGDVVVNYSGSQVRCAIQVWRMVGGGLLFNTVSDETVSSGVLTTSTAVPAGSVVVAMIYAGAATGAAWTGLTEDSDGDFEGERYSAASTTVTTQNSSLTVTATVDVGAARGFLGVAVIAPIT